MVALKTRRLRASSLIETIIASIIFLCIFTISLETISRLAINKNDSRLLIEIDYRIKQHRREFSVKPHDVGRYVREYSWGNIIVDLRAYRNDEGLRELTIVAEMTNSLKRMEYKYILENYHGTRKDIQ